MMPQVNARVNLHLTPVNVGENQTKFDRFFIVLKDKYNNRFYCVRKEYEDVIAQEEASWFPAFFGNQRWLDTITNVFTGYEFLSGELVNLPIPSVGKIRNASENYEALGLDTSKNRHIIPWLTHLKREINTDFDGVTPSCQRHVNDDIYTLSGTACTELSNKDIDSQLYLKPERVNGNMIPLPKNNEVYEGLVIKYNQKNELVMTPLITPSRSTIYLIAETHQKLVDYINKYYDASKSYSIPLNGFIIPIDDWDCFVHFIP